MSLFPRWKFGWYCKIAVPLQPLSKFIFFMRKIFFFMAYILLLSATGCKSEHQNEPDAPKYTTVPDMPVVSYSESAIDDIIYLHINAQSNGSTTIELTYTGITYSDVHTFSINSNAIDTTINVPGTQLYNMTIYGTNHVGNGPTYNFAFGMSVTPPLFLSTLVNGNSLTYDLSNHGNIDISDVVISSVYITDVMGNTIITSNAGNGEPIDISSFSRGNYVLCVVADGRLYTKLFYKRTM